VTLLEARGVQKVLRSRAGASFSLTVERLVLRAGDRVAVVGPSGSGKSTLLGLMALALRPDVARRIVVLGQDAAALWTSGAEERLASLRANAFGFVPQTGALLPFLSIGENMRLCQRLAGRRDERRVMALAERLGIANLLARLPGEISVGERQRAAIGRALAHAPHILLADEPTASVHPAQAAEVLALLTEAATEGKVALLMTTHDPDRAAAAGFCLAPCVALPGEPATRFAWEGAA
jgi:putative ABC transport system ATP-binding protein